MPPVALKEYCCTQQYRAMAALGRAAQQSEASRRRGAIVLDFADFSRSGCFFRPYKAKVGAFVGERLSDMFDISYRDVFDSALT